VRFRPAPAVNIRFLAVAAIAWAAVACNGSDGSTPTSTPARTGPSAATSPRTIAAESPASLGTWRTLAPLPTPRTGVAVAELGGKIYVIGGFEADGSVAIRTFYDVPKPDSPLGRFFFSKYLPGVG